MSGIHRLQAAKLTIKKTKGKELVKELGSHFAPAEVIKINSNIKKEVEPKKKNYK